MPVDTMTYTDPNGQRCHIIPLSALTAAEKDQLLAALTHEGDGPELAIIEGTDYFTLMRNECGLPMLVGAATFDMDYTPA